MFCSQRCLKFKKTLSVCVSSFYIGVCFTNSSHHVANPTQLSNPWTFYNPKLYFTFTTREKKMYVILAAFLRILVVR